MFSFFLSLQLLLSSFSSILPVIVPPPFHTSPVNAKCADHKLKNHYTFAGDSHGDYCGDFVAVLDDNSHWKVHHLDLETFSHWESGETVHVGLNRSWYWFKREHKFILFNHKRQEGIRVMLVDTPYRVYASGKSVYTTITEGLARSDFRRNLILTLSPKYWEIYEGNWFPGDFPFLKSHSFAPNSMVYLGYIEWNELIYFFLIEGKEREATWRYAREGNYTYFW